MKLILSILMLSAACAFAQTIAPMPPLPAKPPLARDATTNSLYRVACPHCDTVQNIKPVKIETNGSRQTADGLVVTRTLTFTCKMVDCGKEFAAEDEALLPPRGKAKLVE